MTKLSNIKIWIGNKTIEKEFSLTKEEMENWLVHEICNGRVISIGSYYIPVNKIDMVEIKEQEQ